MAISSSRDISIIIIVVSIGFVVVDVVVVIVIAQGFALRVFLFARFPERGSCSFSATGFGRFHSSIISFDLRIWR